MATKDWKKISEYEYEGKTFIIEISPANNIGKNYWFVSFKNLDGTFRTNTPNTKVMSSKQKAIAYAKRYMRSH